MNLKAQKNPVRDIKTPEHLTSVERYKRSTNHTAAVRLFICIVVVVAYFLFDYLYRTSISPKNSYLGFVHIPASFDAHLLSILFVVLPVSFLPMRPRMPSDWAVVGLYLFSYLSTAFMARHVLDLKQSAILLSTLLAALFLVDRTRKLPPGMASTKRNFQNKGFRITPLVKYALFILFAILVMFYLVANDFHFDLNFATIYERRLMARELTNPLLRYGVAVGRSLLTVFSIYFFLLNREKKFLFVLAIAMMAIFTMDGTKTTLLIPVFLFWVGYLYLRGKHFMLLYLIPAVLISLSIFEVRFLQSDVSSEYLARRMFAVPGFLNAAYYDFFSHHAKVLLTDSIGRFLLSPVYSVPATFLIGITYFNNPSTNANTGIWMGWYAHFGMVGIFLVSVLSGLVLRFIDRLSRMRFPLLGVLTCSYVGIVWAEQMFHTSFLSGGVFYLLVALVFVTLNGRVVEVRSSVEPLQEVL